MINETETFNKKISIIRQYYDETSDLMRLKGLPGDLQYMIKETYKNLKAVVDAADSQIAALDAGLSAEDRAAAIAAINDNNVNVDVHRIYTDQWPHRSTARHMLDNEFIIRLRA
jgi:hypothetical protein